MTNPPVDPARIEANWRAIVTELDAPRLSRIERMLQRVGLPASTTRLVVATPALRRAWYVAMAVAVLVGLGAAERNNPDTLFSLLVTAPLVPVLGVAMAYGPSADPAHEIHLATPMRGLHLVATRAATVLVVAVVVIAGLSLLTPAARPMAAAWLLPALALTTSSLAMMTVLAPRRASVLVGAGWLAAVVVARVAASDDLAVFRPAGQFSALVVALVGGGLIMSRRSKFDRLADHG